MDAHAHAPSETPREVTVEAADPQPTLPTITKRHLMNCTLSAKVAADVKDDTEHFLKLWNEEFDKLPPAIKNERFENANSNYFGPTVLLTDYDLKPMVLTKHEKTGEIDIRFPARIERRCDSWVGCGDELFFRVNPSNGKCSIHFAKGDLDKRWTGEIPEDVQADPSKALSRRMGRGAYYLVLQMGDHYIAKTVG